MAYLTSARPRSPVSVDGPAKSLDQLMVSIAAGGHNAFTELYDRAAPRVFGLARSILMNEHQAEEVTQEIFVEIWRKANRFDPDRGSALSWIVRLAHSRAVDRVRSSESMRRNDETFVTSSFVRDAQGVDEIVHRETECTEVMSALDTLSDLQRQAITLTFLGGHSYRRASELLEVPVGTLKTRIRDGLLRLRIVMEKTPTRTAA